MILNVIKAKYISDYTVKLEFSTKETKVVDLKNSVFNDSRKIFEPLRKIRYFKKFKVKFNTITWPNEVDFAPEYLYKLPEKKKTENPAKL